MSKFCPNCGNEIKEGADICLNCGKQIKKDGNKGGKSKVAAGILGILLGAFGVHNFYLGYTGKAVGQLLLTILSCFWLSWISAIWGLVEGILILTGSINKDADGNELSD